MDARLEVGLGHLMDLVGDVQDEGDGEVAALSRVVSVAEGVSGLDAALLVHLAFVQPDAEVESVT